MTHLVVNSYCSARSFEAKKLLPVRMCLKLMMDRWRKMEPTCTLSSPGTFGPGELKVKSKFYLFCIKNGQTLIVLGAHKNDLKCILFKRKSFHKLEMVE